MEDAADQSSRVSSTSDHPPRPQPTFKYQFVRDPEDDEEEEDEEEEDEDLEELEVLERKPAAVLSAAPVPAASAPTAPLLDFDDDFVPPAPRGPLPAAPPAAPERHPSWDPSPAPSLPSPSAAAASPSKLPEDDEPPARPPPPPPASVSPRAEPAWTPTAPAPAAPPSTPAAPKRRSSVGSADETLFALPAASEPVIHSSAENIMDSKEKPGNTVSAGQEDFPSVLLETAASLPSLSPLSATSFKEHEYLGNLPAVSPTKGTVQETSKEASREFPGKTINPFVDKDLAEFSELEYSEMGTSVSGSPQAESAITVAGPRKEITVKSKDEEDDLASSHVLHSQRESPVALSNFTKEENDVTFPEKRRDSFNEKRGTAGAPMREEYADFKPFERVWEVRGVDNQQDRDVLATAGSREGRLESKADKTYLVDSIDQTSPERESESSNDDASFPSTPEAIKDGSGAYITCTTRFHPAAAAESISANTFPVSEDHASENKTDEKKIEEKKAQTITEKNTGPTSPHPSPGAALDPEAGYVTTDRSSEVTGEEGGGGGMTAAANMPEGLTPDLVQEACGSELNEAAGTKVAFETKVDLVQTSEALQEPLYAAAQLCPPFEGPEAAPSPVLPDIVMEAPLGSAAPGACAPAAQPGGGAAPLDAPPPPPMSYESVKRGPENPPPYEEATYVPLKKVPGTEEDVRGPARMTVAVQETEAPYISIACDLIKETKVSAEPTPGFSGYSEIAKAARPEPEPSDLLYDSSPESEPVDLFSDDSIPEVPQQQDEAVILTKENLVDAASGFMIEREYKENVRASPPPPPLPKGGKPYLESFQPNLDATRGTASPGDVPSWTQKEKTPLQMEELGTAVYPKGGSFVAKEANARESETFSDSSPIEIIDEFPPFVSSRTDSSKLAREYTDLEVPHKGEVAHVEDGAGPMPRSESPRDVFLKRVQHKAEDEVHVPGEAAKERPDISKVPSLPPEASASATPPEIGDIVKPTALAKEAERKLPAGTEKGNRSPSAILSAELSKTSVVDLLYWRDIKKTGVVFGASLFLLLSLTVFSIVSVTAYIALALLSVTISFRIYKGVIQAIQKSDEGHPFRAYLESDVAISEELVQKYSNSALGHVNCTIKELRRLFLVDDLVDSLKFAVLMWVFTYVGALFNGLTLLILALISLFSVPVIYERHQAQIDHYLALANKNVKDAMAKIQAKIPGLKRKAE